MSNDARHVRWALVTGATQGIGRAIATALARRGWNLVIPGRRRASLDETSTALAWTGARVVPVEADLSEPSNIVNVARIAAESGRLDLLVHSAGIFVQSPWREIGESIAPLMSVNFEAPARLTGTLLPLLVRCRAHVVFVNSTQGLFAGAEVGLYAASKAALRSLADSLRSEVAASGVRVTTIFPGSTATQMQEQVQRAFGRPYDPSSFMAPEDVAAMVLAVVNLPANVEVSDIIMRPMPTPTP